MKQQVTFGLKMVTAELKSLNTKHGILDYSPSRKWRTAPGNGCYLAVTDGLTSGGTGPLIALVKGRKATGATAPDGVVCFGEYRVVRIVSAKIYDDDWAKRKPLDDDYLAKRKPLDDDYEAKCKTLYDDYEAKCKTLYDDYRAKKRKPLFAELIKAVKREPAADAAIAKMGGRK